MKENNIPLADPLQSLTYFISKRYKKTASKNLSNVYYLDDQFFYVDEEMLRYVSLHKKEILEILNNKEQLGQLVTYCVNSTIEYTLNQNQYIQINEKLKFLLKEVYEMFIIKHINLLQTCRTTVSLKDAYLNLVKDHFGNLKHLFNITFNANSQQNLDFSTFLNAPVCSEYSPNLQLQILNINPDKIKDPILDIGCGKGGKLPAYLHNLGHAVTGFDRIVEKKPYLIKSSWFDYIFEANCWNTIISHMSFSNHFIFHHHYKYGEPEAYAQLYMNILKSLKPKGIFCYTPGLPFIESYLDTKLYSIEKNPVNLNDAQYTYSTKVQLK